MIIHTISLIGKRPTNEDHHIVNLNLDNSVKTINNINLFGVFDGHGGSGVSKYLKNNLPKYFLKKNREKYFDNNESLIQYINKTFNYLEKKLEKDHPIIAKNSGSTACLLVMNKCKNTNRLNLWLLNTGDSRGILCNRDNIAIQLSKDHKPNTPEEKKRIEQLGGEINYDGYDFRIKDLSVSRAFGDVTAKPFVTHLPQVYKYQYKNDKFYILACDGLWDVLSNQDAVDFVLNELNNNKIYTSKDYNKLNKLNKINISKNLANYAIEKGSYDNITVIIGFFV